jgi:hypothetical protein
VELKEDEASRHKGNIFMPGGHQQGGIASGLFHLIIDNYIVNEK